MKSWWERRQAVAGALWQPLCHYFSSADEDTEAGGDEGAQLGLEASFLCPDPVVFPLFSRSPRSPAPCLAPRTHHSREPSLLPPPERAWSPSVQRASHPPKSACRWWRSPTTQAPSAGLVSPHHTAPSPDCPKERREPFPGFSLPQGCCPLFAFHLQAPSLAAESGA